MNIVDLYKSILECGNLTTDVDGFVSVKVSGSPVLVNGKRLVLPTNKQLASDKTEKIVFHPLNENILRGESEIITKMRSVFNIRLNYTFAAVAQNLFAIVASTAEHHLLTPDQSEMLSAISEVDTSTIDLFNKIVFAAIKECPEKAFVNIFLKRGGTIGGKKYSRVGVVTFPLYEEIKKADQEIFYGVKLRVKDKLAIKQLYEYILPNLDAPETYNFGTDSNIAPFLHSLMGGVLNVASKFNDVLELFKEEIDDTDLLQFDSDWVESFDNLNDMLPQIRGIPMQQGNEGTIKVTDAPLQPAATVAPANAPLAFQAPAPQVQHQQPWQHHVVQPAPQPVNPGVVVTADGLDFNSLMRARPQIANMGMFVGQPPTQPWQQQQQSPLPRWATPQNQFNQFGNVFSGGGRV